MHHSSNFAHLKFHKLKERSEEFLWFFRLWFAFRLYFYAVALITFFGIFIVRWLLKRVSCCVFILRWQWSLLCVSLSFPCLCHIFLLWIKAHNETSNGLTRRLSLTRTCKRHKNLCNDFQFQNHFSVEKAVAEGKNCMLKIVKLSIVNLTSFIFSMETFKHSSWVGENEGGEWKYVFMLHVTEMSKMALVGRLLVLRFFSGTANN